MRTKARRARARRNRIVALARVARRGFYAWTHAERIAIERMLRAPGQRADATFRAVEAILRTLDRTQP